MLGAVGAGAHGGPACSPGSGRAGTVPLAGLESLREQFGSHVLIKCLWQGSWQERHCRDKGPTSPTPARTEGEKGSHAAQTVSLQQNLIKASDTAGRRLRAGICMAQRRLSAVKLDRALGRERYSLAPAPRRAGAQSPSQSKCWERRGLWTGKRWQSHGSGRTELSNVFLLFL